MPLFVDLELAGWAPGGRRWSSIGAQDPQERVLSDHRHVQRRRRSGPGNGGKARIRPEIRDQDGHRFAPGHLGQSGVHPHIRSPVLRVVPAGNLQRAGQLVEKAKDNGLGREGLGGFLAGQLEQEGQIQDRGEGAPDLVETGQIGQLLLDVLCGSHAAIGRRPTVHGAPRKQRRSRQQDAEEIRRGTGHPRPLIPRPWFAGGQSLSSSQRVAVLASSKMPVRSAPVWRIGAWRLTPRRRADTWPPLPAGWG